MSWLFYSSSSTIVIYLFQFCKLLTIAVRSNLLLWRWHWHIKTWWHIYVTGLVQVAAFRTLFTNALPETKTDLVSKSYETICSERDSKIDNIFLSQENCIWNHSDLPQAPGAEPWSRWGYFCWQNISTQIGRVYKLPFIGAITVGDIQSFLWT